MWFPVIKLSWCSTVNTVEPPDTFTLDFIIKFQAIQVYDDKAGKTVYVSLFDHRRLFFISFEYGWNLLQLCLELRVG